VNDELNEITESSLRELARVRRNRFMGDSIDFETIALSTIETAAYLSQKRDPFENIMPLNTDVLRTLLATALYDCYIKGGKARGIDVSEPSGE